MTSAQEEARRLRELARRYEEQAEKLDRLEPVAIMLSELGDGSVVAFSKQFSTRPDRTYDYAAVKAAGRWYLTGGRERAKTDAGLADFLGSAHGEGVLWSPDTLEVLRRVEPDEAVYCHTCGSVDPNRTEPWYYKTRGRECPDAFHRDADDV